MIFNKKKKFFEERKMEVCVFNEKAKELKRIIGSGNYQTFFSFEQVEGRLIATIRVLEEKDLDKEDINSTFLGGYYLKDKND